MTQAKLDRLCELEGLDLNDIATILMDSVNPGICTNCDYTTEVEPDQTEGWCESCETNTVVALSIFLIEGFEPS